MANQIKKKFIGADQVGASQLLIEADSAVRGHLHAGTAVDLLKLNTDDEVLLKGIKILNSADQIPADILPSYVDDVIEVADFASLPVTGETGKIYVTLDDNKCFRWSGSTYIQITSGAVDSVNGQTGVVVLDTDDVSEGATNKYYATSLFESDFGNMSTDDLSEGLTNLYFTDSRAKSAAVSDSITDGVTDVAPSQNAVFDALALKQAALTSAKEKITLSAGDITAGYVDLAQTVFHLSAFVDRLAIHETEDYTLSVVSGKTRITFAGDLLPAGASPLVAGDNIFVKYLY